MSGASAILKLETHRVVQSSEFLRDVLNASRRWGLVTFFSLDKALGREKRTFGLGRFRVETTDVLIAGLRELVRTASNVVSARPVQEVCRRW